MVRWRYCLVLATLLLLPRIGGKIEDDEEEERSEEGAEEDEDDDDEDEDESERDGEKMSSDIPGRRAPGYMASSAHTQLMSRTTKPLPLECFVCAYKSETPLRSCLDPTKYRKRSQETHVWDQHPPPAARKRSTRNMTWPDEELDVVHSVTCQNPDDKCFTSVISKDKSYDAVVRGCRTGCINSAETTCCSLNRCNNQAFAMPLVPHALTVAAQSDIPPFPTVQSSASKNYPSTVLFFVTVLLVLQTVVKVSFV